MLNSLLQPFGLNDVVGCYLDLEEGSVKWSKNGVDFGEAYEIPYNLKGVPFYAAVVLKVIYAHVYFFSMFICQMNLSDPCEVGLYLYEITTDQPRNLGH